MTPCIKPAFLAAFFVSFFTVAVPGADLCVVIDSMKGTAEIQRAGRQQWQKAAKNMKLYNNDIIHVLPQGFATLTWPDGSTTFIHQNSQMLINLSIEEPPKERIFNHATVFFGAVFFLVKKIAPRGLFDDSNMRIYTPTAVMSIRGTAFGISVDKNAGTTTVKVVNGTVQVRNILKSVSLFLGPAHQTTVSMNTDPLPPSAVLKADLDSLKSWVPGSIITAAMEKQLEQARKDHLTLTEKLEDKCVVTRFANNSGYHGPWPVASTVTKAMANRLGKLKPKFRFVVRDSTGADPFELARKDSARFVIAGALEAFDITQHAEISTRADEYREYASAVVRIRLRLLDASSGKQLAEELHSGEIRHKNAVENSWQKVNKLTFDLADEKFASSILGRALNNALARASEKMARYIE
ncbi:MAG: FecR domain-containing protein [Chitinispirillaceae bacterium]|nr:FecR domain-containing protein [Chitinispirillaceae bacterium]